MSAETVTTVKSVDELAAEFVIAVNSAEAKKSARTQAEANHFNAVRAVRLVESEILKLKTDGAYRLSDGRLLVVQHIGPMFMPVVMVFEVTP